MTIRDALQRAIRPSKTRSVGALWAKSLLNAVLFFAVFMLALPWLAHWLLPVPLALPAFLRHGLAGLLFVAGIALWLACLDAFSRHGRGTPLPMDAPRDLVTSGPFAVVRNPIMLAELGVIWAVALHVASLGVVAYAGLVTTAAIAAVRRVEEPELRERFGAHYEAYCERVPRWLPRLRRRARDGGSGPQ
jgi:protein-S-isoprenylcysteine O-methyltransferase Ste14